jgi:hypothetical protein
MIGDVGCQRAVSGAVRFLADRQLPSGQLPIEVTWPGEPPSVEPDSSPFATAFAVYSLSFSEDGVALKVISRALEFLRKQVEPPGVWRYWTREHALHKAMPADVDDTACISYVLRRHSVSFPDNRELLLANRDADGRFFTWIVPRLRPFSRNIGQWRAGWLQWRHPLAATLFWRQYEASWNDVDAVVNANALAYCGECHDTKGVVDFLIRVVKDRKEGVCDKWYHRPLLFHYALSRCAAQGVRRLKSVRQLALERIATELRALGDAATDLDLALAVCARCNWEGEPTLTQQTSNRLLARQAGDGGWESAPFYTGGRSIYAPSWGSRELTSALCVEALLRAQL